MDLQKISQIILSVFFDMAKDVDTMSNKTHPQCLSDHYRNEIQDFYIDEVYVGTTYEGIKKQIESYKYHSEREYVSLFVDIFGSTIRQYPEMIIGVVMVPVPMHWTRYMIRGFDHIRYLVRHISQRHDIQILSLIVSRMSARQSHLSKQDRIKNRKNAFSLKSGIKLPNQVLLIDDVISTGHTLNNCAKLLKEAGVERVDVFCIASNQ